MLGQGDWKMVAVVRAAGLCLVLLLAACAPEVGSRDWCEDMRQKPKGDWTMQEAKDYAKHCVFDQED